MFEKLYDGAYRLKIPFENIYTSVFLFLEKNNVILLDSGCNSNDVKKYILPALANINLPPTLLLCSHLHSDHCGGIEELLKEYPNILVGLQSKKHPYPQNRVLNILDNQVLYERLVILNLKGHTDDCIAIFDKKHRVLFSTDCLQLEGVGRFNATVVCESAYMQSINRVKNLNARMIIASHEYSPLGFKAVGEKQINDYCSACLKR